MNTVLHELIEKWRGETFQGDMAAAKLNVAVVCALQLEAILTGVEDYDAVVESFSIPESAIEESHLGMDGSSCSEPPGPEAYCKCGFKRAEFPQRPSDLEVFVKYPGAFGASVEIDDRICDECPARIPANADPCPACGAAVKKS